MRLTRKISTDMVTEMLAPKEATEPLRGSVLSFGTRMLVIVTLLVLSASNEIYYGTVKCFENQEDKRLPRSTQLTRANVNPRWPKSRTSLQGGFSCITRFPVARH